MMYNDKSFISYMSRDSFLHCIEILISKFNVVNKRIWGTKILLRATCKPSDEYWQAPLNCRKLGNEDQIDGCLLLKELNLMQCSTTNCPIEIIITELLPKNYTEVKAFQLVVLDKDKATGTFYDITPVKYKQNLCPKFTYCVMLENGNVILKTNKEYDGKSYEWLSKTVLPQFIKWGENNVTQNKHICSESLNLISKDKYYVKYNELKVKYGQEMVKIWPEVTDPTKFVYEDVAIATYLLLLWEDEDGNAFRKKVFVDLGCGNGLLVYILTKEGHSGVGIDIRKRKIWDMYSEDIQLKEKTITPADINLFPEADWVIGNHSDELTPWIPVIAARSSYKCNFFVLPCCAYNFDGTKYQRKDSSKSQYTEYLEYIKQFCETCGFQTKTDRLKIPSTKRISIIGQGRCYTENDYEKNCDLIQNLINPNGNSSTSLLDQFKPRDPIERVRNCTQIDKAQINSIVHCVTDYLLEGCNADTEWSNGREVSISRLIVLLSKDNLKVMKAECGGLQTLLKNNHHIFQVHKGKVKLRYPKTMEEVNKSFFNKSKNNKSKNITKLKPCWFYNNHPQGCPLTDNTCSYLHTKSEYQTVKENRNL